MIGGIQNVSYDFTNNPPGKRAVLKLQIAGGFLC